jgi:phage/plasmid-associated DNA primase
MTDLQNGDLIISAISIGTPTIPAPIFEWRLKTELFKSSIFDKKEMNEIADIKKVYGFIKNKMGINYKGIKRYSVLPYSSELDQIIKYKECYNKKTKKFNVSFHLPKHKWGRITPSNYTSLSVYHRPTRHSLCDGIYIDIDMVNCQPKIIMEICSHHHIPMVALKKYVDNTQHFRQAIMRHHKVSKDIAKRLPICLMFGGSYDGWIIDNKIITNDRNLIQEIIEIETEIKSIIEIVYTNNKDTIEKAVLKADPSKWKDIDEKKRGVMALWSQSVERLCQETSITYLVEHKNFKIENIVPCQDGFMILKELWYADLITDIELVLKTQFNLSINYIQKPFDEAIVIPIYDNVKSYAEWNDLLSAKKLADRYIEEWNKYIIIEDGQIFLYKNNRWWNETDKEKRYKLTLYISEDLYELLKIELLDAVELDEKELSKLMIILRNMTSKGGAYSDIIRQLLPLVKQTKDTFNKQEYLLGFENGLVDLRTKEFREYEYDDYMTITTKYDYKEVDYGEDDDDDFLERDENGDLCFDITAENIIEWTENRRLRTDLSNIIETIQPNAEQRILYLQVLASGLDGRPYQKLFLFNGQGGNGKGLTGSMMGKTLGEYFYQAPNGLLKDAEKSNTASPDMYNCMNKRYINFKEVGGLIKVAMMRNLTGGGDFTGRLLNCNPIQFKMTSTFVMEFNNAPDFDVKAQASDYRRLTHIDYPINFTDDENKIDKIIGGIQYRKANTFLETDAFLLMMRPIFLDLLLGVYKSKYIENKGIVFEIPKSVRERTEKFIEDQNLFQKVFNDLYKKCEIKLLDNGQIDKQDEKKKTIKIKDMWQTFEQSDDYRKIRTSREKREYGRDEYYKWCESMFKIEGNAKTGKIIKSIILKDDDDDIVDIVDDDIVDIVDDDTIEYD